MDIGADSGADADGASAGGPSAGDTEGSSFKRGGLVTRKAKRKDGVGLRRFASTNPLHYGHLNRGKHIARPA